MIKAHCPNNPEHQKFITVAHVSQEWIVDSEGNFLEEGDYCAGEVVAWPRMGNTWTCVECGTEAKVERIQQDKMAKSNLLGHEKRMAGYKTAKARSAADEPDELGNCERCSQSVAHPAELSLCMQCDKEICDKCFPCCPVV